MIKFLLLLNRQGKIRLAKWYVVLSSKEKARITREIIQLALRRSNRLSNIVEHQGNRYVYRRYASLFFIAGVDDQQNELLALEIIHFFVEALDRYFGSVCELDLIFNFQRAYYILDEMMLGGEVAQENRRVVLSTVNHHDELEGLLEGTLSVMST